MSLRRWPMLLVAAVATLALAACGDSTASTRSASYDPDARGPLDEIMAEIYGGIDDATLTARQNEIEDLTAACMHEAGFEYTPQQIDLGTTDGVDEAEPWYTEEYARANGYGMFAGGGAEDSSEVDIEGDEGFEDPNADYLATMTDAEIDAYNEALYGPSSDMGDETDGMAWEMGGCAGDAQEEVWGDDMSASDDFSDLNEAISDFYDELYGDNGQSAEPGMRTLNKEWSACMAKADYDYASPTAAMTHFNDLYNDVMSSVYDEDTGELNQATYDASVKKYAADETDTAVADRRCQTSVNYLGRSQQIEFAAQQKFVDQHRAELDAWLAASSDQ